ncbi:MAG: DNA methyltransferase [Caulobacteraceae bacterium]
MTARSLPLFDACRQRSIVDELAAFRYGGVTTKCESRFGVPFFFNEFWTSRQRQGHSLHEVSYRACFKSQLPEFFIERLTSEGDTVHDPFMGRGTTPIQATLMGRRAVGNDINPLSVFLTRPRTNPPTLGQLHARLGEIDWKASGDTPDDLLAFYHPDTLSEISALRTYLLRRDAEGRIDAVDDWIRMVAINRLTGHSPGFFSVYSLPPNQAVSVDAQRKINAKRNQTPERRNVGDIIVKKSRSLMRDGVHLPLRPSEFHVAAADKTPDISDGSVDLVVTSPPFLDVVQYASDNWLRCWFSGIDVRDVEISMHKKPSDWMEFVRSVFGELARVVRPGGHVAFEVGEVRGGRVDLETLVLEAIAPLAFDPLVVMVNVQEFTKTANCWGVSNNAKGTNTNRIVVSVRK